MKLLLLGIAVACQSLALASQGVCQEKEPQPNRPYLEYTETSRLYFMTITSEGRRVDFTASSAQRVLSAPLDVSSANIDSVLHLKGDVEVRVCSERNCSRDHGSILVHADAVDYNDKTQEIDAHGDVRIEPYRSQSQQNTIVPR
jgi:lipopolysaccharide assembly outer membrane protein LptD (OstA)